MISLLGMAIFSGLSLNLLLQFALGTAGTTKDILGKSEIKRGLPFFQYIVLFLSSLFLWIIFRHLMPNSWTGFSELFLVFPLSALLCMGFELLGDRIFPQIISDFGGTKKVFSSLTAYEGLVPASLILTFLVADNFVSAFVLTLFFAIGNMTAMLVLSEIRRRSTLEWIPQHLKGSPLILISMGLLSLISVSVAGICFRILEIF